MPTRLALRPRLTALVPLLLLAAAAGPAHALRVTTWNVTLYPTTNLAGRQPHFRTVMTSLPTDVMIVQEMLSQAGADSFLNVLQATQPKAWGRQFILSTQSAVYWDSALVDVTNFAALSNDGPRDILFFIVKPNGYVSNQSWFRIYSVHLKAGTSCTPLPCDSTVRRSECTDLRNRLNTFNIAGGGPNFMVGGDYNFYGAFEGGYVRLTESQPDNDGRSKDPLTMPGPWHQNSGYALYHTQCPCNTGCPGGFSGGGMDDRFDLWLTSYSMQDGEGLDLIQYTAYGNDGAHYNQDINGGGFNLVVPLAVANALHQSADHLPVHTVVQVPARIAAGSQLDFGTVIEGATVDLAVSNPAGPPADELTYSFAAPAGFTAPGGTFNLNAGAPAATHAIGVDAGSPGARTGTLIVTTDDPDSASKPVQLSASVLAHASPSLDSMTVVLSQSIDMLSYAGSRDTTLGVHNFDFDALQARLDVNSGVITGGGGRFSIVGGFTPALLSGTGQRYTIHFDDTDATQDSIYEATLTFSSADGEALPGATARPDLVVSLRAVLFSGTVAVGPGGKSAQVRFHPPQPNPVSRGTRFTYELPVASAVSLEIFDLSGRRVSSLVSGTFEAGRRETSWDGTGATGARLPGGLYFARFSAGGVQLVERVVLLP
jgi:hypothetical protein